MTPLPEVEKRRSNEAMTPLLPEASRTSDVIHKLLEPVWPPSHPIFRLLTEEETGSLPPHY